jgi:hypothetical protein
MMDTTEKNRVRDLVASGCWQASAAYSRIDDDRAVEALQPMFVAIASMADATLLVMKACGLSTADAFGLAAPLQRELIKIRELLDAAGIGIARP